MSDCRIVSGTRDRPSDKADILEFAGDDDGLDPLGRNLGPPIDGARGGLLVIV